MLEPGATVGILGGGQLGRMLAISAAKLGLRTLIFCPETDPPAAQTANGHIRADYGDEDALTVFASACDVVTLEFENVPLAAAAFLADRVPLRPGIKALEVAQDRLTEKVTISALGIGTAPFVPIDSAEAIPLALESLGGDGILKTRRLGYDGKGQVRLTAEDDPVTAFEDIGSVPAVLEAVVPFAFETSVLLARATDGETAAYALPVNTHKNGILDRSSIGSFAGHTITAEMEENAIGTASTIAQAFDYVGLLAVELFVLKDGALLVNEIAPRVHNSGHWTIEACAVSQFDNHIRAVAGWPLGSSEHHSDAELENLIGEDIARMPVLLADPASNVHHYGKAETRAGRKMGHVTRIAPLSRGQAAR